MYDFFGGAKLLKANYVINFFKGFTPILILMLMYYYQNFSLGAYLYVSLFINKKLILHGSYGVLWFLKDIAFPD